MSEELTERPKPKTRPTIKSMIIVKRKEVMWASQTRTLKLQVGSITVLRRRYENQKMYM